MVCSDDALRWLSIVSVKGISMATVRRLYGAAPPAAILDTLEDPRERERLTQRLGRVVEAPDRGFVDRQLALLRKANLGLVSISDDAYPGLLREISVPPALLYFAGTLSVLARPSICVVGSRRASRRGLINARALARELSETGVHVVSGLARGIDSAAHEGALGAAGSTSAVLGCGVDVIYPPEHASLAGAIVKEGCIVSEFPLGTPPLKHHFPQRNRILSGLALGVVVVEAGLESGAMGTVAWAVEQNREVFAVPGPIDHPGSAGPHRLIREGARLVEGIDDILAELPSLAAKRAEVPPARRHCGGANSGTADERALLAALDLNPKHIDELVRFCHISPAVMLPMLLDLEMRGAVVSCGGGAYALAASRRTM